MGILMRLVSEGVLAKHKNFDTKFVEILNIFAIQSQSLEIFINTFMYVEK